jgi:hypothetical protein
MAEPSLAELEARKILEMCDILTSARRARVTQFVWHLLKEQAQPVAAMNPNLPRSRPALRLVRAGEEVCHG